MSLKIDAMRAHGLLMLLPKYTSIKDDLIIWEKQNGSDILEVQYIDSILSVFCMKFRLSVWRDGRCSEVNFELNTDVKNVKLDFLEAIRKESIKLAQILNEKQYK